MVADISGTCNLPIPPIQVRLRKPTSTGDIVAAHVPHQCPAVPPDETQRGRRVPMPGSRGGDQGRGSHKEASMVRRCCDSHLLMGQPSTSAIAAWIRSSAVRICVRSRSLFFTAARMPSRPLRLVPPATFRSRPRPRLPAVPLDDLTL
jgi:hypothetical protein